MGIIYYGGLPTINVNVNVKVNVAAKNIIHWGRRKLPILAAAGTMGSTDYLERECGVSLKEIGDDCCVMSMALDNGGSSAKLMLPSGLVTSFKPQMWHGATMELLHTSVSAAASDEIINPPLVQGGLSLALSCQNDINGIPWSPNDWSVHQVTGTPQDSIQIQLISTSSDEQQVNAQVKHIITLGRDALTSEVIVSNSSTSSSIYLTGSAICHLAVSTPDAAYAIGLQSSDFFIRPPFAPNSTIIIPPDFMTVDQDSTKTWLPFNKLFATRRNEDDVDSLARRGKPDEEAQEEDDNYKHLTDKLCRIYTSAPRNLTIIDRGRRNSVTVGRNGFEEVYILSPGSEHEWYNKYSYICIGNAALLQPIILKPQTQWKGGLQLWNPNS
ncbi:hypothetical protein ABFX02_10G179700 [Erythranthe guttata]